MFFFRSAKWFSEINVSIYSHFSVECSKFRWIYNRLKCKKKVWTNFAYVGKCWLLKYASFMNKWHRKATNPNRWTAVYTANSTELQIYQLLLFKPLAIVYMRPKTVYTEPPQENQHYRWNYVNARTRCGSTATVICVRSAEANEWKITNEGRK